MDAPLHALEEPAAPVPPTAEQVSARLRDFQVADHERRGGRRRRKGNLLWLLAAAVLAGGSVAGYSYRQANNVPEVEVFVYTGKPSHDVLLDLSGFVVPRTKVVVSPQVNGIITRVLIPEEGQKVKTGDLLFEVDATRYQAEYDQSEAALATAWAQLKELENGHEPEEIDHARALYEQALVQERLATMEYDRIRNLSPNTISKSEHDHIVTNYHDARAAVKVQKKNVILAERKTRFEKILAAKAEVKRAQATLERAKYYLDRTRIHAPPDSTGKERVFTVLQKNVNPGESIQADFVFTTLCTLADLSEMEAEIDVQERDLRQLNKGLPCQVIPDAYPDRAYRGKLSRMQPLVNRQRGVVQVKVTIEDPDALLLPDMNSRVLFLKETDGDPDRNLPRIPLKALAPQSASPAVFVFDGQAARLRTIQIGAAVGDSVEVRDGLKPEDKILLPLGPPLKDGEPVRLRGAGKDGAARKDAI
jgi:RND family efflux transporter MFP subunit